MTVAGREFLEAARRVINETDNACARLKAVRCGASGRLAIGVYASFSVGNLRATLIEHRRRFHEIEVYTVDGRREDLLDELRWGGVDIAIMAARSSGWDDCVLPLWSERIIVALPESHLLTRSAVVRWSELVCERILVPRLGPGPELERLIAGKLDGADSVRLSYQDAGLDRLLSLVSAGFGILLLLEGGTGANYDDVVFREVHDDIGPVRLNFAAYWRKTNSNPTLVPFLDLLRERYPDLSAGAFSCDSVRSALVPHLHYKGN